MRILSAATVTSALADGIIDVVGVLSFSFMWKIVDEDGMVVTEHLFWLWKTNHRWNLARLRKRRKTISSSFTFIQGDRNLRGWVSRNQIPPENGRVGLAGRSASRSTARKDYVGSKQGEAKCDGGWMGTASATQEGLGTLKGGYRLWRLLGRKRGNRCPLTWGLYPVAGSLATLVPIGKLAVCSVVLYGGD